MKTILSVIAATIVLSAAAQTQTATPQPVPMTAPAMKVQNAQSPQQNSQSAPAPKASGTTTETKKAENGKPAESAPTPAVDNKIAVSDPGTPGDKGNNKKATAPQPSEQKKVPNSSAVSPK